MFREVRDVSQVPNDYFRRKFIDESFELYVWYKSDRTLYGFQLCYNLTDYAKALTWREDRGYSHHGIDSGEQSPLANRSPILTPCGQFDAADVLNHFCSSGQTLPIEILDFVREKIKAKR